MRKKAVFLALIMSILMLAAMTAVSYAAPSGAIFTTNASGTVVNGNVYDDKYDVFLNGGPQPNAPCTAAGLPDGDYYYQVTNPSGALLLSTDSITNRTFRVVNGLISSELGSTHGVGTGKCGSISIQLMPYDDTDNPGGEYKVWVTPVGAYVPPESPDYASSKFGFVPGDTKTDNFKIRQPVVLEIEIFGMKFYDTNTNGQWDPGEPLIPGWRIEKIPPTPSDFTFTGQNGSYSFLVSPNSGQYLIKEIMPGATWVATTPTSGTVVVATTDVHGPNFGNVCIGAGGGRTLGYWSNQNGQALMEQGPMSADLAFLSTLCLRNADGSDFDPLAYAQFRTWILGATATNMAYMLSAQLAAMELNVLHKSVDPNALVYAPGINGANAAGFIHVTDLLIAANNALCGDGLTKAGDKHRAYQEKLKNALDKANNNLTFVQPAPCSFTTPY